jgi:protein-L-isoaspartate(D-aspartate) O-methyltransferase
VLRVMRSTPRHEFVPETLRSRAYEDTPLPIGRGQTISQPYIVALMTESLDVDKSHRVLEIGTGSGYQAAVLAQLVKHVYTMEIVPELAVPVKKTLARYENITVRQGDGYQGWPEEAPFDRIILTAAPPELPPALIGQLKPGGLLLAPVGGTPWDQKLVLVKKNLDGTLHERSLLPVVFVPMVKE